MADTLACLPEYLDEVMLLIRLRWSVGEFLVNTSTLIYLCLSFVTPCEGDNRSANQHRADRACRRGKGSAVAKILAMCKETWSTAELPRSGSPKEIDIASSRSNLRRHLMSPDLLSELSAMTRLDVSGVETQKCSKLELKGWMGRQTPRLTKWQRMRRLAWASIDHWPLNIGGILLLVMKATSTFTTIKQANIYDDFHTKNIVPSV